MNSIIFDHAFKDKYIQKFEFLLKLINMVKFSSIPFRYLIVLDELLYKKNISHNYIRLIVLRDVG